jgi:SHS2 domain-containing protein
MAPTLEGLFRSAAKAVTQTMVEDLATIRELEKREVHLYAASREVVPAMEELLHEYLQKIVFYKDAELLLLKPGDVEIIQGDSGYEVRAVLWGEPIDPLRHELQVDVKAVTLHRYQIRRTGHGWQAVVVLDV